MAASIGGGILGWKVASWWSRREILFLEQRQPALKSGPALVGGPCDGGYLFITSSAFVVRDGGLRGKGAELEIPLSEIQRVAIFDKRAIRIFYPGGRPVTLRVSNTKDWAEAISKHAGLSSSANPASPS